MEPMTGAFSERTACDAGRLHAFIPQNAVAAIIKRSKAMFDRPHRYSAISRCLNEEYNAILHQRIDAINATDYPVIRLLDAKMLKKVYIFFLELIL
jgi:hypothetical protein